jgi:phosphatidate cytidylyltransferase
MNDIAAPTIAIEDRVRQELSLKRVVVGVLIAVAGLATVLSAPLFGLVVLVIGILSSIEFARLSQRAGAAASLWVLLPAVSAYIVGTFFGRIERFESGILVVVVVAAMLAALAGGIDRFAVRWGMTVLAVLYLGKIGSYLIAIRQIHDHGTAYMLWFIVVVGLTDTMAMLGGLRFGRTPMLPRISPNKTWEGAATGFIVATAVGTLLAGVPHLGLPWYVGLTFSAGVSVAALVGDLVESALKRNAQVKDSGNIIAGHGGVLDRFDSYLLAAVVGYAVLLWFGRVTA